MPRFEVEFVDGRRVVELCDTADIAKARAKASRRQLVPADTPRSAPEVKITRVSKLEE